MPWLRSRVEVLGGFGGATGVMTNLSVDAGYVINGLERPYFSITQEQSIASGLPVYNAGSGWQALGAGISGRKPQLPV
jgi:outer membrane scaffolding protein for murein synthesis (MipA/OmpV family)